MRFSKKSAATVVLSSIVIVLFCLSSFSTSVSSYSGTLVSGPAKIAKIYSVSSWGSLNWAGYAINASQNSVTQVKGSWKEPTATCPAATTQIAAFWVGIDGLTSPTVEQTGTMAECVNGVTSYFAWYEFYPNPSVIISTLVIHPGDVISATVKYSSTTSKFTTTIKDVTTAKSFSHSSAVPGALRSSAEWIAEAPLSCTLITCIYPLANFGIVSFGKDTTLATGTDTATIGGVTKPISKFGSEVDSLTMVNVADTAIKALPSATPSLDGTSFSVTWMSAGP
jgi:Peptidase A4 family